MQLTLEKKYLPAFFLALKGTEDQLTLKEARIRDRFLKDLVPEVREFEEVERKAIYEKFCVKNPDGTPLVTDNEYRFNADVTVELNKELTALLEETVSLDVPRQIKDFLENSTYKPKLGESEQIDHLITVLK